MVKRLGDKTGMMTWLRPPNNNKLLAAASLQWTNKCVCVCVFALNATAERNHFTTALPSAAILPPCPRAPLGSQGPNQSLALAGDLLTPAVSALIKTSSTQCGPRSCTASYTILTLSTFNTHAHTATYARVHTVAHHADPESGRSRNSVTFNPYE